MKVDKGKKKDKSWFEKLKDKVKSFEESKYEVGKPYDKDKENETYQGKFEDGGLPKKESERKARRAALRRIAKAHSK
jgi:hypothetical protein